MKIYGTAKGAALSTKDFGVAFGGAAALCSTYPDSETTNVQGTNDGGVVTTSNQKFGDGFIQFNGSDQRISIDDLPPYINTSSKGSVTFWFRPSGAIAHGMYMFIISQNDAYEYFLVSYDSSSGLVYTNLALASGQQWEFNSGSTTVDADEWGMVAVVQNGTAIKAYVNNVAMTQVNSNDNTAWLTSNMDLCTIGAGWHPTRSQFEDHYYGGIQDLCIWDSNISSGLRDYIWNEGTGRTISQICPTYTTSNIISYYKMQSLSNSTLLNDATPTS